MQKGVQLQGASPPRDPAEHLTIPRKMENKLTVIKYDKMHSKYKNNHTSENVRSYGIVK